MIDYKEEHSQAMWIYQTYFSGRTLESLGVENIDSEYEMGHKLVSYFVINYAPVMRVSKMKSIMLDTDWSLVASLVKKMQIKIKL